MKNKLTETNFTRVIFALVFAVGVIIIIGAIRDSAMESRDIYKTCVSGCSAKHFSGVQLGLDETKGNPYVIEFDRTDCMSNCDIMYLRLKQPWMNNQIR